MVFGTSLIEKSKSSIFYWFYCYDGFSPGFGNFIGGETKAYLGFSSGSSKFDFIGLISPLKLKSGNSSSLLSLFLYLSNVLGGSLSYLVVYGSL